MPRSTPGPVTRRRHKKTLRLARGFYGRKKNNFRLAKEQLRKSLRRAWIDRRRKKRDARSLWQIRINAAARENGVSYSRFIDALKKAGSLLNRKVLSEMALHDPEGFALITRQVAPGKP